MSSIVLTEQASSPGTPATNKHRIWIDSSSVLHVTQDDGSDFQFHRVQTGTWTPTLTSTGGAYTIAYTLQEGHYIKIGQLVQVSFRIEINTISGGSGNARIGSLPFTSANISYVTNNTLAIGGPDVSNTPATLTWGVNPDGTDALIRSVKDNTAISQEASSIFANGDILEGNGTYRAAS